MPESQGPVDRTPLRILYCRCAYAKAVPQDVKDQVLAGLCASGQPFDTVADLCEMSARRDPALKTLAETGDMAIVACYPRAVRGLFKAAQTPLRDAGATIFNMRELSAEQILDQLGVNCGCGASCAGGNGRMREREPTA